MESMIPKDTKLMIRININYNIINWKQMIELSQS